MKKLLFLLSLIPALAFAAPATTNSTLTLAWDWTVPPTGGLPTTDFLTNVVFQLYSSQNLSTPSANWTPSGTFTSSNWTFNGVQTFTASIPATNAFLFYALSAKTTGGESPFSNMLLVLPVQGPPFLKAATGKP